MATFTITRNSTSLLSSPLTVNLTVGGTAVYPTDYTVSGANSFSATAATVIIPANQLSANIVATSVPDATIEPNETVILTFSPQSGMSAGASPSAVWTITNDD